MRRSRRLESCAWWLLSTGACVCQVPVASTTPAGSKLTLAQAESTAIANQPRLLAAQLRSRASAQRIREARSGLLPTVVFNTTGVRVAGYWHFTAAGAITTVCHTQTGLRMAGTGANGD